MGNEETKKECCKDCLPVQAGNCGPDCCANSGCCSGCNCGTDCCK